VDEFFQRWRIVRRSCGKVAPSRSTRPTDISHTSPAALFPLPLFGFLFSPSVYSAILLTRSASSSRAASNVHVPLFIVRDVRVVAVSTFKHRLLPPRERLRSARRRSPLGRSRDREGNRSLARQRSSNDSRRVGADSLILTNRRIAGTTLRLGRIDREKFKRRPAWGSRTNETRGVHKEATDNESR